MGFTLVAVTAVVLTVLSFRWISQRLTSQQDLSFEDDWQWLPLQPFAANRYGAMKRLLAKEDFEYLANHPRFQRKRLRRFRAHRREMFRSYLACLHREYKLLCAAIRMLMAQSVQDRPDLAVFLLRQRMSFALGMVQAELTLALHAAGIGQLRDTGLIDTLEDLARELKALADQTLGPLSQPV